MEFIGLAIVTRACRLDERGEAREPGAGEAGVDGLPEPLMRMDEVDRGTEPSQRCDRAADEAQGEERATRRGSNPAMDQYPVVILIVDRIAGNRAGDHMDVVPPSDQLQSLRQCLTLGTAGERVEVADDVADTQWP